MDKEMEFETRVMLTCEQYFAILHHYSHTELPSKSIDQINYYFDTKSLSLLDKHIVLRIRKIDEDHSEITLKVKGDNGDEEYNQSISKEDKDKLINNFSLTDGKVKDALKEKGLDKLDYVLIGSLRTYRTEIQFPNHLLVIDKNEYLDVVDYNLEIESSSMSISEEEILKYCQVYGMTYKKDYLSKSRRLFNLYKKN